MVATTIMLCLADRVETKQGDPRVDIRLLNNRRKVVSYGNRLFCDTHNHEGNNLRHRWGSATLYRKYFQDYRNFLARPDTVARGLIENATENSGDLAAEHPFIVCTDLSLFYDRVSPALLQHALDGLSHGSEEEPFFAFAKSMLKWQWHIRDRAAVEQYEADNDLIGFSKGVSLPQGLVAAGFFANVVLLALDDLVINHFRRDIAPGIRLHDCCRYVDDIRLVVSTTATVRPETVGKRVCDWLQRQINVTAPGLTLAEEKTRTISFGDGTPQLIRIGATMNRIQTAISGGFDAMEGERILDTVQSLIKSQPAAFADDADSKWYMSPVPDVRDDTLARFCAGRFRTTYRSLRPLLESADIDAGNEGTLMHSQKELDDQARSFALGLIDRWAQDPANIRVLKIGLDVWPHVEALKAVLELLDRHVWSEHEPTNATRVALYCLAEIFRAGATETGIVESTESLHGEINIAEYRALLRAEAQRVMSSERRSPWYLRQQAFLFLAATGSIGDAYDAVDDLPSYYSALGSLLSDNPLEEKAEAFATAAILVRRALRAQDEAVGIVLQRLNGRSRGDIREKLLNIGVRDLSFLEDILNARSNLEAEVEDWLLIDLGRLRQAAGRKLPTPASGKSLASWIQEDTLMGPLRNELTLVRFAAKFLEQWQIAGRDLVVITPSQVYVDLTDSANYSTKNVNAVAIAEDTVATKRSIYRTPGWCPAEDRWRLQLGYLLRFILAGRADYTRPVLTSGWREGRTGYRPPENHWYLRRYGFFNAQQAFGDDWLPISDWVEDLLIALLGWPGCQRGRLTSGVHKGLGGTLELLKTRISQLEELQGRRTGLLILPVSFASIRDCSSIRACVAQTAIPGTEELATLQGDPMLNHPEVRGRHRNHLAAVLMAVRTMVSAQASHRREEPRLDWLILPELAVHPSDVRTHLIPFARAHKSVILTGLTYQKLQPGRSPVNSALWLMPEHSPQHGLQMRVRRQGKRYLAPDEEKLDVEGFRPCQWLIEYPSTHRRRRLRLTASICYDATDLRLASDLRDKSDVFAIPALNKDVRTFDRMALALHYHMFQLVVVANNGEYGGSSAYWPKLDRHERRIFHLHGQQMSVAFLEIDGSLLDRHSGGSSWKHPPAGLEFLSD